MLFPKAFCIVAEGEWGTEWGGWAASSFVGLCALFPLGSLACRACVLLPAG